MNSKKLIDDDELNFSHEALLVGTYYNVDFKTLESMGYKRNMIKKVYAFLRPTTLERAINLMTKENGKYPHKFFKDTKHNKKTCYICGESPLNHIDYKPEILSKNNNNNNKEIKEEIINLDDIQNDFTCPICGDLIENNNDNVIKLDKCGDEYCINCWYNYLENKIEEGFVKIKCMNYNCEEILNKEFILNIIKDNKKLISKYEKFSNKLEILSDPNKVFCPYKNCDSYGERKNDKEKYIKCKNGHQFCFLCLKKWHGEEKCEKKEDEEIKIWKKNRLIKKCPNCEMYTEKNDGCNHMTCGECKYQWCWLCNGKYTINHYKEGKCNGLLFYKPSNDDNPFNQSDILKFKNEQMLKNQKQKKIFVENIKKNQSNSEIQDFLIDHSISGKILLLLFTYFFLFEFIAAKYFIYIYHENNSSCLFYAFCYFFIFLIYFSLFLIQKFLVVSLVLVICLFYFPLFNIIYEEIYDLLNFDFDY